jgi:hypothetical protein
MKPWMGFPAWEHFGNEPEQTCMDRHAFFNLYAVREKASFFRGFFPVSLVFPAFSPRRLSCHETKKTPCFAMCENGDGSKKVVHPAGLEPTTYCSGGSVS